MKPRPALLPLLAGLCSGALYILAVSGGTGILIIYLPLIPLFMLGFTGGFKLTLFASLGAGLLALLLTGFAGALNYAVLIALPAVIFIRQALWWRENEGHREWYPLLSISIPLTLFVATTFLLNCALMSGEPGGLEGASLTAFTEILTATQSPGAVQMVDRIADWVFLIFGLTAWFLVPMIYVMAWLSHAVLEGKTPLLRPHFRLEVTSLPISWLLALVGIGLLTFLDGQFGFVGKTLFIMMLVPYFLNGLLRFHDILKRSIGSWWIIAIIYIFLILNPLFLLLLTGWGLLEQWFSLSRVADSGRRTD